MKMEQTECSETLAFKLQTPVNHTEESVKLSEQGESLKSRIYLINKICSDKYQESFSELSHYSENAVQSCRVRISLKLKTVTFPTHF
jgi:hypothetical protein